MTSASHALSSLPRELNGDDDVASAVAALPFDLLVVVGPHASGKTSLIRQLVEREAIIDMLQDDVAQRDADVELAATKLGRALALERERRADEQEEAEAAKDAVSSTLAAELRAAEDMINELIESGAVSLRMHEEQRELRPNDPLSSQKTRDPNRRADASAQPSHRRGVRRSGAARGGGVPAGELAPERH